MLLFIRWESLKALSVPFLVKLNQSEQVFALHMTQCESDKQLTGRRLLSVDFISGFFVIRWTRHRLICLHPVSLGMYLPTSPNIYLTWQALFVRRHLSTSTKLILALLLLPDFLWCSNWHRRGTGVTAAIFGLLTWASLEPRDDAVPFSLLVCACVWVCVCVCRVITTNVLHVQTKTSWIYKIHI